MKIERRLLGNVAILGAGEFVAQLANFLFVIIIARAFGPELLGHYSLSMAVTAIVVVFVSFGTIQLHVRNIGRNADDGGELLRTLFPAQAGLAIVAWIAIVSAGVLSGLSATEVGLLAAIAGYQILVRMTGILLAEPKGRQQMNPVAVVHAGTPILILCVASVLLWMSFGPLAVLSVMPACAFIFAIFAARTAIRLGGPLRTRWTPRAFAAGLKQARPFFAIMLLTSAYERLGVIILGIFASRVIVGEFAAGERIVAALGVLISVVTTAALPALSSLAADDKPRLLQVADRLIRVAWLAGLPVATVISLFSSEIIHVAFGDEYKGASAVLAIASILLVIRAIRAVLAPTAMAIGRPGDLAFARAMALVALVCAAPFLITLYGAKGLAGTMVFSEVILLTVLSSRLAGAGCLPRLIRPALGVMAASGIAYTVGTIGVEWPFLQRVTVTLLVGILGLWLFRAVRTDDIRFVKNLVRRKRSTDPGAP